MDLFTLVTTAAVGAIIAYDERPTRDSALEGAVLGVTLNMVVWIADSVV